MSKWHTPHKAEETREAAWEDGGRVFGLIFLLPLGINTSSSMTAFHDNKRWLILFAGEASPPTQFLNYAENVEIRNK